MATRRKTLKKRGGRAGTKPVEGGALIVIGGGEDRENDPVILREVARRAEGGRLVITTLASEFPDERWEDYQTAFRALGLKDIKHLHFATSEEAHREEPLKILSGASCVFFTGGDQLRITTKLGGTPAVEKIFEIFNRGGTIAGTSAGASVMGETMLVGRETTVESHKVGNWMMAPGLGLIANMIIDQHFAQRGRIGRLLRAVALNPGVLGIGIDENTAIIIENESFRVAGENAVYVIDGGKISYTNISEAAAEKTMSMFNVQLHILAGGDCFDLKTRTAQARALGEKRAIGKKNS